MISSKPFSTILSENADQLAFDAAATVVLAIVVLLWAAVRGTLPAEYREGTAWLVGTAVMFWLAIAFFPAVGVVVYAWVRGVL
ncbi:MAG TPA: hypothetical protein ENJ85_05145 [Oceanithermus profundus]|uniref:Uncharacterized protein n=1 Tax=Oceanithermus profundus TaxID=187137 RepID=A0A7C5SPQ6_9DEIN|nr:hypothetical protein [Oceanithermus profundus]